MWGLSLLTCVGALAVAIILPLCMLVIAEGEPFSTAAVDAAVTLAVAVYGGALPAKLCECFPPSVRQTGVGLAYNFAQVLFGSSISVLATTMSKTNVIFPAIYVSAIGLLNVFAVVYFSWINPRKESTLEQTLIEPKINTSLCCLAGV
eukprot:c6823_g1_i2.p1 GENE.c6823_g1_i2~~c6823_g1_i2.p1  ORF type:complete len:148 (+),score=27.57 c6823_g1_i2:177-620(+)